MLRSSQEHFCPKFQTPPSIGISSQRVLSEELEEAGHSPFNVDWVDWVGSAVFFSFWAAGRGEAAGLASGAGAGAAGMATGSGCAIEVQEKEGTTTREIYDFL